MALTHGILCYLSVCAFFVQLVVAPPPKGFFVGDPELPTSTQLSLEDENDKNSIWDEDEDVFDLDGDSWLKQPPAGPLSTWPTSKQPPRPSEFDDGSEDNMIDDDDDGSDEDHDGDGSEFVLIPEVKADEDKRDMKVRHTGHYPENDVDASDDNLEDADVSPESNDGEMIVSFPESNASKDEDFNDDNDGNTDDDLFGDQDEDDSKKLFEDRVFLF